MVELLTDYTTQIYHVLSTDSRPDADPGAQLREIDTGKRYIFDGNSWNELAAGGTTPTLITKTLTENGTYAASSDNADGYSEVTVNVAGSGDYVANDWLDMTKPVGDIATDATSIDGYVMHDRTNITKITALNATNIGVQAFQGCSGLEYAIVPLASLSNSTIFGFCSHLLAADVQGTLNTYTFRNCTNLKTLVLRGNTLGSLGAINVFNSTPFASGGSGGTLYVPSALIASYQAATNWSTILGYDNNQILPIEGSIYETQYVDGTPIT